MELHGKDTGCARQTATRDDQLSLFIIVLQEKFAKQKANEARLEEDKKNLRMNLDDAENRVTRGELARRSLEGELQRLKLGLNDKETENQVLH